MSHWIVVILCTGTVLWIPFLFTVIVTRVVNAVLKRSMVFDNNLGSGRLAKQAASNI